MDLNRVSIIGNLTRDPKYKAVNSQKKCCSFSVAVNYGKQVSDEEETKKNTTFFDIIAWGKLGEICNDYLSKGKKVFVEGRLKQYFWNDQEGNKKSRVEVVANHMIILSSRKSNHLENIESQQIESQVVYS